MNCEGFNYQCCQNDIEQGVGTRQELATDCAKTCFRAVGQGRSLLHLMLCLQAQVVKDCLC